MLSKNILAVFGCLITGTLSAPADVPPERLQPTVIPIVAQSDELEANGTYKFSYETGNGIMREETAYEKVIPRARDAGSSEGGEDDDGDSNEIHVQRGSYSYTAPDGTVISVSYIADENGFQPIGDHLPRSPVLFPISNIAEKSGRALKIADSSASASAPTAAKVVDKPIESAEAKTKPKVTPVETPEEENSVSLDKAKPESKIVSKVNETKAKSVPASSTEKTNLANLVSTLATEQNDSTSGPITVTQEAKSEADTSSAGLSTTETISTIAEAGTTEASEATSMNVDVSTEAASTAASAQSTTESEQASTVSVDQASTSAPESTASGEVSEQPSSTSAPESTSFSELVGSSTSTEAVNQSSAEQTGQPSTIAPELASTEQSSSTTTA